MDRELLTKTLQYIAENASLETRWLYTLYTMEFAGATKIAKAIQRMPADLDMLEHWKDETRHAFVFRKLADRAFEESDAINNRNALSRNAALRYFHRMDRSALQLLKEEGLNDQKHSYLLTTLLIENRAMKIYPLYRSITKRTDVKDELTEIIKEEANHKKPLEYSFYSECENAQVIFARANQMESTLFSHFWQNISTGVEATLNSKF